MYVDILQVIEQSIKLINIFGMIQVEMGNF